MGSSGRTPTAAAGRAGDAGVAGIAENEFLASQLDRIAALLESQRANPFRVRAYHLGAAALRALDEPAPALLERGGLEALTSVPHIGDSLARAIRDILRLGYSPILYRLRGDVDPVRLLATVPGIGRRSAARLHDDHDLDTLEDLEAAAHDGRLARLPGFGPKRLAGVRAVLAQRLGRTWRPAVPSGDPPVGELLQIDRDYRAGAAAGTLPLIAPRRFNPGRRRWLPVLHATVDDRHYTALFSNTARAHRLGRTDDWVVIFGDHGDTDGQWTVVTERTGALKHRRVIRGRERECEDYYERRVRSGRRPA